MKPFIKQLKDVGIKDVSEVGGKNASLGEMIQNLAPKGVKIPGGFIVTDSPYKNFNKKIGISKRFKAGNSNSLSKYGRRVRQECRCGGAFQRDCRGFAGRVICRR